MLVSGWAEQFNQKLREASWISLRVQSQELALFLTFKCREVWCHSQHGPFNALEGKEVFAGTVAGSEVHFAQQTHFYSTWDSEKRAPGPILARAMVGLREGLKCLDQCWSYLPWWGLQTVLTWFTQLCHPVHTFEAIQTLRTWDIEVWAQVLVFL